MAYKIEADVQRFYLNQLSKLDKIMKKDVRHFELSTKFMRNINTDGYFIIDNTHLVLCEFKNRYNFSGNLKDIGIVILQALYYMKDFKVKTALIPEALFIGDEDEYFIISTEPFLKFLDTNTEDSNWNCAPSDAYRRCPKLLENLEKLVSSLEIPRKIKKIIDNKIDLDFISRELKNAFIGTKQKIKFNSDTVNYGYKLFSDEVLFRSDTIPSSTKILLFRDQIMKEGRTSINKHRESIEFGDREFSINMRIYNDFKSLYQVYYTQKEQKELLERILWLYKERERVEKSAYPKEKEVVDYAHKMMVKHFGRDWKTKFIVWDPRCYTGNMTNSYKFENLYLSDPESDHLELLPSGSKKNCKQYFQFDFKNDDIKSISNGGKIPDELYDALVNTPEKVIIFTHPEIGYIANGYIPNSMRNSTELFTSRTLKNLSVRDEMHQTSEINHHSSQELYNIYLFRCVKLKVFAFGIITTSTYLRSSSNKGLKDFIFRDYAYIENFAHGNKFAFVFNIYKNKMFTTPKENSLSVLNFIKIEPNGLIKKDVTKEFYTGEGNLYWKILKSKYKNNKQSKVVLTTPINEKKNPTFSRLVPSENYLGTMGMNTIVRTRNQARCIFSSMFSNVHINICTDNLFKCCAYYAVRSVIKPNIYNEADDFLVPLDFEETSEQLTNNQKVYNPLMEEFMLDSLILCLFENNVGQSSLRIRNGSSDDIKNEWYPLGLKETQNILKDINFEEAYNDSIGKKDSYIFNLINKYHSRFSPEALNLLDAGRKLFLDTFKLRSKINLKFPELQLDTWDCGYWQLRTGLERTNNEKYLSKVRDRVQKLEEKLRKNVYALGFLK